MSVLDFGTCLCDVSRDMFGFELFLGLCDLVLAFEDVDWLGS